MQTLDDVVPGFEPEKVKKSRKGRKPKVEAAPAEVQAPAPVAVPVPIDRTVAHWATFGVAFTLMLSAALNGLSNAQHAPAVWAGWLMGLSVPVLVLVLSKVAGEKWRAGQHPVAWLAGGAGVALLALSVWHCAQSIALLTGSPVWLSLPMAVAVDVGLVACEVALISEPRA
ncbi:MAG TPA: hypothetical protein VGE74_29945 [Gemmata sp.]